MARLNRNNCTEYPVLLEHSLVVAVFYGVYSLFVYSTVPFDSALVYSVSSFVQLYCTVTYNASGGQCRIDPTTSTIPANEFHSVPDPGLDLDIQPMRGRSGARFHSPPLINLVKPRIVVRFVSGAAPFLSRLSLFFFSSFSSFPSVCSRVLPFRALLFSLLLSFLIKVYC